MIEDHENIRSSERKPLNLRCVCRVGDGTTLDLELLDLSMRGVRLTTAPIVPQFGDRIMFYLYGDEPFAGTVRSTDGKFAGVEFDNELPAAIYERLLYRYASFAAEESGRDAQT